MIFFNKWPSIRRLDAHLAKSLLHSYFASSIAFDTQLISGFGVNCFCSIRKAIGKTVIILLNSISHSLSIDTFEFYIS